MASRDKYCSKIVLTPMRSLEPKKMKAVVYVEEIELAREVADEEVLCADRRA